MRLPKMPRGNGGFTLVELLVVILIIVTLAVGLLPLLGPEITKAQYVREGLPAIANIRVKTELFKVEKQYLPGVPYNNLAKKPYVNATSLTIAGVPVAMNIRYSDLTQADGAALTAESADAANAVQWMQQAEDATGDKMVDIYYSGALALNKNTGASTGIGAPSDHVWSCIDYSFSDLTGVRLRPQHVKYAVVGSAGDSYLWVVGCFGDDSGLKAGCGYAVAEFNDVVNKRKFVATFARYKPLNTTQLAFDFAMTSGSGSTYKTDTTLQGNVGLPPFDGLMTADNAGYNAWIQDLKDAGWDVQ